ncbi:phage tail sheath protein [Niameybacter massiliensis]|uniref:Phage tail sheath protein n=1 Tax=Holtiella tumoricola TaxID=3018743 RepID=A0AA42DN32_9FIRM|nr:phage tail sheath protein [Holtiella tumoricola]MDA3732039.1 phage tail sheath protein [Holtiella tumoricola]
MYKHGAFAEIMATKDFIPPKDAGTLPVYFGTLPAHQKLNYEELVNKPILINSFKEAQEKVGYSEHWEDFTLCEAIYAHFKNNIKPIGPIILINVLDPKIHLLKARTATLKRETVSITNKVGFISTYKGILKTISINEKVMGEDYKAEYTPDGGRIRITDLKGTLGSSVEVTFNEVDLSNVTKTEIIGGTSSEGHKTGIDVLDLVYQNHNMIPTLLCAPKWSKIPEVDTALKAASQKINGHWYAFVNSDIESSTSNTIDKAKAAKTEAGFTSSYEAPCWPMAKNGEGKLFHLSTLATVTMQWVDYENGNVPHETPSNKPIDIIGLVLEDGTTIEYDQIQANELNSKGIRTATYWGGRWVLWGGHTGEYEYGKDMDKRNIFDCSVRMIQYIANSFQSRYGIFVDKPMNRAKVDTILNDMQEWLDALMAQGKILHGLVGFEETSNSTSDMIEGDFTFDIETTTTPPGKSLTAKICYTSKGLNVLFGGDQ